MTAAWNDLQKETITTHVLPAVPNSPTGGGNPSFNFSVGTSSSKGNKKDIRLDLKTLVELKNDRKFCSFCQAFKNGMRSKRLGYFWNEEHAFPVATNSAFPKYEYHCTKIMSALEHTCQTPASKLIVRKHIDTSAARVCLAELEATFTVGMSRKLELQAADTDLQEFKLEPSYNKSLVSWLHQWANKEANYSDFAEDKELYPNSTKRQILESAIFRHPEFWKAIKIVLLKELDTNMAMEWNAFWNLISDYALQADTLKGLTSAYKKRQANQAKQKKTNNATNQKAQATQGQGSGRGGGGGCWTNGG